MDLVASGKAPLRRGALHISQRRRSHGSIASSSPKFRRHGIRRRGLPPHASRLRTEGRPSRCSHSEPRGAGGHVRRCHLLLTCVQSSLRVCSGLVDFPPPARQGVCQRLDCGGLHLAWQGSEERHKEVGCGTEINRLLALGEPFEYRRKHLAGFPMAALASPKPGPKPVRGRCPRSVIVPSRPREWTATPSV
jgi:hypothetical protein